MAKKIYYDQNDQPIYNKDDYPDPAEFRKAFINDKLNELPVNQNKDLSIPQRVTREMGSYIPQAAGAVGERYGGPAGAGVAGGVGSAVLTGLQKMSPDYFGEPSTNPVSDVIGNGVIQSILSGGLRTPARALANKTGIGIFSKMASAAGNVLSSIPEEPTINGVVSKLPQAVQDALPQRQLPLTRNARGQFNKAQYAAHIPGIGDSGVISTILRLIVGHETAPTNADSPLGQKPAP